MPTSTYESTEAAFHEERWVKVGQYPGMNEAFEHSLVILSQGSGCRVYPSDSQAGNYELETPADREALARKELAAYAQESQQKPMPALSDAVHDFGVIPLMLWAIVLLISYRMQISSPEWQEIGMNSSISLIDHYQWWRPFTSLFLHADLGHLLSNLLTGSLFAVVLHRYWGTLRTWSVVLFSGVIANCANSIIRYPEAAESLGASTAVMAMLGLLCSHGCYYALHHRKISKSLRQLTIPLFAGIALFGLTGNSTEAIVNVLGHTCGFVTGFFVGFPISWEMNRRVTGDKILSSEHFAGVKK